MMRNCAVLHGFAGANSRRLLPALDLIVHIPHSAGFAGVNSRRLLPGSIKLYGIILMYPISGMMNTKSLMPGINVYYTYDTPF